MRIRFAATTTAILTVLLAGCGAPAPAPTPPAGSPSAPAPAPSQTASAAQPTATAAGEVSLDEFINKFGEAYRQVKTYAMEMTMGSAEAEMISATGVVDQSGGSFAQQMKMKAMGMDMEMIQVDDAVYMLIPGMSEDWMKMSAEQAGQQGIDMPAGPDQMLEQARDSFQSVEFVGAEEIDGVATEHYRLTLAPDAVDEQGAALSGYDVWLDEVGFTRKIVVELTADGDALTTELLTGKINEPVSIKAPEKWVEMPS